MNTYIILLWGLRLAGLGQLFIVVMYQWMRRIVDWDRDLEKLRPHNRAIAHTYSRYIQALNGAFGLICLFQSRALLAGTSLAADLTLLIGLYWGIRALLGVFYYDTREVTAQRQLYRYGEYAFNTLFAYQAAALLAAFFHNIGLLTD